MSEPAEAATDPFEALVRSVNKETAEEREAEIRHLAALGFAKHAISQDPEAPNVFLCKTPGTAIHSFRVAFLPAGLIVVYGDIGDMMLQRGGLGWLRGAVRGDYVSSYVMGKRLGGRDVFVPGDGVAILRNMYNGVRDGSADEWIEPPVPNTVEAIIDDWLRWDSSGSYAAAWFTAWAEHTDDDEPPSCKGYSANDLWCYFALEWFVRNHNPEAAAQGAPAAC